MLIICRICHQDLLFCHLYGSLPPVCYKNWSSILYRISESPVCSKIFKVCPICGNVKTLCLRSRPRWLPHTYTHTQLVFTVLTISQFLTTIIFKTMSVFSWPNLPTNFANHSIVKLSIAICTSKFVPLKVYVIAIWVDS